ncbi:MAG: cobalamin B12-binding domain-containing protein [bacterium]
MDETIRVLVAKLGLDGHDRGALIIAQSLKEAGMEVIYTGLKNTPEVIADIAVQEDVDVIGVSILSGAHLVLMPILMEALKERRADDIPVVVGGVIPPPDIPKLRGMNIKEVFPAGSAIETAVEAIRGLAAAKARGGKA